MVSPLLWLVSDCRRQSDGADGFLGVHWDPEATARRSGREGRKRRFAWTSIATMPITARPVLRRHERVLPSGTPNWGHREELYLMKIVVFGAPPKRNGALRDRSVVDLSYAYAKYLQERTKRTQFRLEMAEVVVPSDLARLIEGGPPCNSRAAPKTALDYLFWTRRRTKFGPRGEKLVHGASGCALTRSAAQ